MNKIIKNVLIGLFVLVVLVSVGANAYFFGWLTLRASILQEGVNGAAASINNGIKNNGSFTFGTITCVPTSALQPKK